MLMTMLKSKIGVVSQVISVTESESEESECFQFSSDSAYNSVAYVPLMI